MLTNEQMKLTSKNLDWLSGFLADELNGNLAEKIPNGAHIFHGSYHDRTLTQANLRLAAKILLGITLGYVDDAPLVMIFEKQSGESIVINLSDELQKGKAQKFIETFQEQNQQEMSKSIQALALPGAEKF